MLDKIIGKIIGEGYVTSDNECYAIEYKPNGSPMIHCVGCGGYDKYELEPLTDEDRELIENAYETDVVYCDDCGQAHDVNDYNPTFINCPYGIYCRSCVEAEYVLKEMYEPQDIRDSKDLEGVNWSDEFELVGEFLVDSSGFGSENERALTIEQAESKVKFMIENSKDILYCGLTGIGQFQVYVGIFKIKGDYYE